MEAAYDWHNDFIRCQEDDCQCRSEFPEPMGGPEHDVVDNNEDDPKYRMTVMCEWAIDYSHGGNSKWNVTKCAACSRWMRGLFFSLGCDQICRVCTEWYLFEFLKEEFHERPCDFFECFPNHAAGLSAERNVVQLIECSQCGKSHPEDTGELDGFYMADCTKLDFVRPATKTFHYLKNIFNGATPQRALLWNMTRRLAQYLKDRAQEEKRLEEAEAMARKKRGRQLMSKYFGVDATTDEVADRCMPRNYIKRGWFEDDVDELMRGEIDVEKFVRFLRRGFIDDCPNY